MIFIVLLLSHTTSFAIITNFDILESRKFAKSFSAVCQIGTSYADGGVHWGTGVLVSPNTVLTAAHVVCPGREIPRGFVNFNQRR